MNIVSMSQFLRDRKAHGVEYAAKHISSLGFDGIEWFARDYDEHIEDIEQTKSILQKYGLSVSCYTVLVPLFGGDRSQKEAHMLRHVETAAAMGVRLFQHTVFPPLTMEGVENTFDEVYDGIIDLAELIAKKCNELGMTCIYEHQGVYFNGIDNMERFLTDLKSRGCNVGICGDFGNPFFVDVDSKQVFEHFASDIHHVHVKDFLVTDTEEPDKEARRSLGGKYIYSAELCEGSADFEYGFAQLAKVGYSGDVSFEFCTDDSLLKQKMSYIKQVIKDSGLKL